MQTVKYIDAEGRNWVTMIPDDAPIEHAQFGVPLGPPSLASLGLPLAVEVALHNQLVARKVYTARDAQKRRIDVLGALQAALGIHVERIAQLYKEAE